MSGLASNVSIIIGPGEEPKMLEERPVSLGGCNQQADEIITTI